LVITIFQEQRLLRSHQPQDDGRDGQITALRIRHYAEKYGEDEVEAFLDRCMSIDDLIDIHSTAIRRRDL